MKKPSRTLKQQEKKNDKKQCFSAQNIGPAMVLAEVPELPEIMRLGANWHWMGSICWTRQPHHSLNHMTIYNILHVVYTLYIFAYIYIVYKLVVNTHVARTFLP